MGTLKSMVALLNKLFIKSNPLPASKNYCQNGENYEINSF